MKTPNLESERLNFRPVSLEHLAQEYVNWLNDWEVYKFLQTGGNYTLEMLKSFLTQCEVDEKYFWAIHLKSNDQHIGNIKIDPINFKHGLGEYGIMMGKRSEWGKGYAREASQLIIDYCFNELNLRKITLGVVLDNVSAVQLYNKLGFEIEGVYKKHAIYDGRYRDILRMALFNSKFIYEHE